ncbi:hypothetical protein GGR56DRAFT_662239 [Xylariaceae sp. FL0804]|nr:hypothetical protein GGR56DRAFT_662239 [Xylariaceae sp. FL0804]
MLGAGGEINHCEFDAVVSHWLAVLMALVLHVLALKPLAGMVEADDVVPGLIHGLAVLVTVYLPCRGLANDRQGRGVLEEG